MDSSTQQLLVKTLQQRLTIRRSLRTWCEHALPTLGVSTPIAAHQQLLISELERARKHGNSRTIFCLPPGSAKSTYTSKLAIPWLLTEANTTVLACSYKKELIESFGGVCRDLVKIHADVLGYNLSPATKAKDEWETTNGGRYFCAGTNAGIAGYRANFALIDDPIGSEEDAKSQTFRDKLWAWFWDDFIPRLSPNASVFILANRRHEDDLVGRLKERYPAEWREVKLPLVIDTDEQAAADPLGRKRGQWLWPEYFTEQKVLDARKSDQFSGLYQQDPTPAEGDLIKVTDLVPYTHPDQLPDDLRIYVGSDHALTEKEENDRNCLIPVGVDHRGIIWVLPDVYWDRCDTKRLVDEMLALGRRRTVVQWWAESDHIEKAIGPFLKDRMQQERTFFPLNPLVSSKDLVARSSSIRGMMRNCQLRFPVFASWWPEAKHEMLTFPLGKHDDFIAALSEIGRGLQSMTRPAPPPKVEVEFDINKPQVLTLGDLHKQRRLEEQCGTRYGDR